MASTISARGEAVDFDRMTLDAEKAKNQHLSPHPEESGTSVKPRTIPRGSIGKPTRGFVPEQSVGGSESMATMAGVQVRKSSRIKGKVDNVEAAASEALDDILGDLPKSDNLPKESAYTDVEEAAQSAKKSTRKTTKK